MPDLVSQFESKAVLLQGAFAPLAGEIPARIRGWLSIALVTLACTAGITPKVSAGFIPQQSDLQPVPPSADLWQTWSDDSSEQSAPTAKLWQDSISGAGVWQADVTQSKRQAPG